MAVAVLVPVVTVAVPVVNVRRVGMGVLERLVPVQVAVLADRHRVVGVRVVTVVVPVRVLVLEGLVKVLMLVLLAEVQPGPERHQRGGYARRRAAEGFAERRSEQGAEERRDPEDRRRSARAEAPLGEHVKAEAQPVARRAAGPERGRVRRAPGAVRPNASARAERERRAERALGRDDRAGVEVGERSGHGVVTGPRQRRDGDRAEGGIEAAGEAAARTSRARPPAPMAAAARATRRPTCSR